MTQQLFSFFLGHDAENATKRISLRQNQSRLRLNIIPLKSKHNRLKSGRRVTCDGSPHRWATWRLGRGSEDLGRKGPPRSPSSSAPECHPHLLTQDHITAQHLHTTALLWRSAGEAASVHHVAKPPTAARPHNHFLSGREAGEGAVWLCRNVGSRLFASEKKIKMRLTAEPQVEQTIPLCWGNTGGCCAGRRGRRHYLVFFWVALISNAWWWWFTAVTFPPTFQMITGLRWNLARKPLRLGLRNSFSAQSKCYVWRCANLTNGHRHYCIIVSIKQA